MALFGVQIPQPKVEARRISTAIDTAPVQGWLLNVPYSIVVEPSNPLDFHLTVCIHMDGKFLISNRHILCALR